jgi:hypothetical protein
VILVSPIKGLDFLPSGKLASTSMGIINSTRMKEFFEEVRTRYDYVFFDSPPIMGVSDASVLASLVDMVVLVVQHRKYPQSMTLRAKQTVEKVGGNLLGIVLNNISINQDSYYYYYSGYYYDYYSKNYDSEGGYGGSHSGEYGYEGRRRRRRRDKKGEDASKKAEGAEVKVDGEVTPEAQGQTQGDDVAAAAATDLPEENAGGIKKY